MKAREFRNLGREELAGRIREMERDLQQVREEVIGGKEKNHAQLKQLRRELARAHTVLKETTS